MTPPLQNLDADLAFSIQIAQEAGQRLVELRDCGRWPDEKILGDVGDQAADGYLQGYLRGRYPLDGILSEETADSTERTKLTRAWIVDPLDGTKEYRSGRDDFAVHVALTVSGKPAVGAVALPAHDAVIWGVCVPGHERGGVEPAGPKLVRGDSAQPSDTIRMICSRSHTPDWMESFAAGLGKTELVRNGSVGYKVSRMLYGEADLYVHKKGLKEWDTCAPEVIARALGWHVCRMDGSTQAYNQVNPYNDELVICRPEIKDRVIAGLAKAGV